MVQYVTQVNVRIETPKFCFWMRAGVPQELNEDRGAEAVFRGAQIVGAEPATSQGPIEDPEVVAQAKAEHVKDQIRDAIQTILDEGGELTPTGVPKINQVRKYVKEATPQQRDEVWETFFQTKVD